jgi:hypothetical protein
MSGDPRRAHGRRCRDGSGGWALAMIRRLAEKVWSASRKETRVARTVVLKLKTSEFYILSHSYTADSAFSPCAELTNIAISCYHANPRGLLSIPSIK